MPDVAFLSAPNLRRRDEGNSLIEVALFAPILILLACYAVNFGYYSIVALNLAAATRDAAEYSIQGSGSPLGTLPSAGPLATSGTVASLALGALGGLNNASTKTSIEVCTPAGSSNGTTVTCTSYGASGLTYTADTDPESSMFQCNRVDIVYTISPPIPLSFFGTVWTPPATFHRMVEMRVIN